MRQSFEIPGRLDGLNAYTSANRSNAHIGAKMKKANEDAVMWAAKAARLKPMRPPVRATFTWVEKDMRRDKDNIASAKKFVFDALVKLGILGNDNWQWVEGFEDRFALNKANPRVIVELEEAHE